MLRAFIAVDISDQQRSEVDRVLTKLMSYDVRVKWVRIRNVHITLKFLGETSESILPDLYDSINGSLADKIAFDLSLAKLGCFPNPRNPRVIWVGIKDGFESLQEISGVVEQAVEPFGFKREKRKFSAHLTLGRVKDSRGIDSLVEDLPSWDFTSSTSKVTKVVFYQSILRPQGPLYTSLKEFELIHEPGGLENGEL